MKSPDGAWGRVTTMEDVAVKARVIELLGRHAALSALERFYPDGTVKGLVDKRRLVGVPDKEIFDEIARDVASQFVESTLSRAMLREMRDGARTVEDDGVEALVLSEAAEGIEVQTVSFDVQGDKTVPGANADERG